MRRRFPALLLTALVQGDGADLWLPAVGALALAPLVVVRLGGLVRQNEKLAAMETTLRSVGERLVAAETRDDVARIITVGLEQVLGMAAILTTVAAIVTAGSRLALGLRDRS